MQNDQERNALVPGNHLVTAADFVASLRMRPGVPLPRGQHGPALLHQPLRRGGQHSCRSTPRTAWWPLGRMARREADLGDPGPAPAPAELRPAHPLHGGVRRQLHPGQSLELHRRPHRRAGQPAVPGPVVTPPGGTPDSVTKNGFRNFLSNYANGTGSRLDRERRDGRRDPADRPAARRPGGPGRVRRLRAELGEHLDVRPGRQSRDHVSTTRPSATAASATSPTTSPTGPARWGSTTG